MLATPVEVPFSRTGWIWEPKLDGYRLLAVRRRGEVRLLSRNLKDWTAEAPGVAGAVKGLPGKDLVLDGELVALDAGGKPRFQLLQERGGAAERALILFDCLERDGRDLTARPLHERRRALQDLVGQRKTGPLRLCPRLGRDGRIALDRARRAGWEGVVGKDEASLYEPGRRSGRWMKVKVRRQDAFVVGGFTLPRTPRPHFGALLVGLYDGKVLRYCGRVGSGFSEETTLDLLEHLQPLEADVSTFEPVPAERDAIWVRPRLVVQVAFAEWTAEGRLRQPSFLGLVRDRGPRSCRR